MVWPALEAPPPSASCAPHQSTIWLARECWTLIGWVEGQLFKVLAWLFSAAALAECCVSWVRISAIAVPGYWIAWLLCYLPTVCICLCTAGEEIYIPRLLPVCALIPVLLGSVAGWSALFFCCSVELNLWSSTPPFPPLLPSFLAQDELASSCGWDAEDYRKVGSTYGFLFNHSSLLNIEQSFFIPGGEALYTRITRDWYPHPAIIHHLHIFPILKAKFKVHTTPCSSRIIFFTHPIF